MPRSNTVLWVTALARRCREAGERSATCGRKSQEVGEVSGQMLLRGRVKKGKTDKGALDFATRRPVVTSRSRARRWWAEE